jgi:hypothetical protein
MLLPKYNEIDIRELRLRLDSSVGTLDWGWVDCVFLMSLKLCFTAVRLALVFSCPGGDSAVEIEVGFH